MSRRLSHFSKREGPDNPLGEYAIKLSEPGLFIHGTNRPLGVGQRVSHGCIRLYAPHIRHLATTVPNGTTVRIVHQPYKVGWRAGTLYLEAHPDTLHPGDYTEMVRKIVAATTSRSTVNWSVAYDTARAATGLAVAINQP